MNTSVGEMSRKEKELSADMKATDQYSQRPARESRLIVPAHWKPTGEYRVGLTRSTSHSCVDDVKKQNILPV